LLLLTLAFQGNQHQADHTPFLTCCCCCGVAFAAAADLLKLNPLLLADLSLVVLLSGLEL
jgi:hypothetical protein